ncbi:MAG: hypothetical protein K2O60_07135, partial [Ruminococcus sp.]|nr:hypothetical protein [Ruminococcus sp.]
MNSRKRCLLDIFRRTLYKICISNKNPEISAKPIDNIGKVRYNINIAYQSGGINKNRGNYH